MKRLATLLTVLGITFATLSANADIAINAVTPCDNGRMHYDNAGWLIDRAGERVDYHTLVAASPNSAMDDVTWHKMIDGADIVVCREDTTLRYVVVTHLVIAEEK